MGFTQSSSFYTGGWIDAELELPYWRMDLRRARAFIQADGLTQRIHAELELLYRRRDSCRARASIQADGLTQSSSFYIGGWIHAED
jgi:hypothetical protein